MAIPAGNLTERIKVQTLAYTRNEIGEQELRYQDIEGFEKLPAMVKFGKSLTQLVAGQIWEPTSVLVTTRYSEKLLSVRRIEWQGKIYDVDGMPNGDRVNGTITYTCALHDDGMQTKEITE